MNEYEQLVKELSEIMSKVKESLSSKNKEILYEIAKKTYVENEE